MRTFAIVGVVFVTACSGSAARPGSPTTSAAPAAEEVPAWLLPDDGCPAEVVGLTEAPLAPFEGICKGDLAGCLERCRRDDTAACYAAAIDVQAADGRPRLENALFLRACALGRTSGCTNRAAALLIARGSPVDPVCAVRTFEITCARRDPWGCAMFGRMLYVGSGTDRDLDRAMFVLPVACEDNEDDPACADAREVMDAIERARTAAP